VLTYIAEKEGYLFVYLTNEEPTAKDIYFDGPEGHPYPYHHRPNR
jgi:hypothetical protein